MSQHRKNVEAIIMKSKSKRTCSKSPAGSLEAKSIERSSSPKDIALRYQQLCLKYKNLLLEVQQKAHQFEFQEQQLQIAKAQKQRDQKQLFRLRSMIGFIRKHDQGVQVNVEMQSTGSWNTKNERSTSIQNQQQSDWNTPLKKVQSTKLIRSRSPHNCESNLTATGADCFKTAARIRQLDESAIFRKRIESIHGPKPSQSRVGDLFAGKQGGTLEIRHSKLSNSPYSKLRFSKKIDYKG